MPISQKPKSLHGTNGPDAEHLEIEEIQLETHPSESNPKVENLVSAPEEPMDVTVAGDSADTTSQRYSATDARLATRMSREIATHLGLNGKSRSVRI